jgi:hypothetical protein
MTEPWVVGLAFRGGQLCGVSRTPQGEMYVPVSRMTPQEIQQAIEAQESREAAKREAEGMPT